MKLLLIRHAESCGNRAGEIQGQQDTSLSDQGIQQAVELERYLRLHLWSPSHVYSSPLQRSRQTAEIASETVSVSIQSVDSLQEIHNGVLQGLTWEMAQSQYPELCTSLMQTPTWIPIPQAESPQELLRRAQQFWEQMWSNHHNSDQIWIFTHGGFLQYLMASLLGCDRIWGLSIQPTALFEIELNLNFWTVETQDRWNTTLFKILKFNYVPST